MIHPHILKCNQNAIITFFPLNIVFKFIFTGNIYLIQDLF